MNMTELNKRDPIFRNSSYLKSLHLASARKPDDGDDSLLETHALSDKYTTAGNIQCLDFDAVKLASYPPVPGRMTPCSVDALVFEHNGTVLIEFKFKTAAIENITRKAYDSVMLMIEHGGYTFAQARKELSYIVVSTGIVNRMEDKSRALWRSKSYGNEPWKRFRSYDDHWKTASLEGVIVKEAYCMHPATFDYFVRLKHWKQRQEFLTWRLAP